VPGRSRALQIAERFGLDPEVVADARSALGEERVTLEATISALETARRGQGLTLVHFTPQPEPFMTQNTPYTPPGTP
jgi:dsDNA-specific endonuclease/ATPase MutS2